MMEWTQSHVSADHTHHVLGGQPLYNERFDEVLKFHAPGLAPVRKGREAWHIDMTGRAVYARRFERTFGFYEGLAAVMSHEGWHHIRPDGRDLYPERYDWCGNYQEGRTTVRDAEGRYRHLDLKGRPVYPERWLYAGDYRDGMAVIQDSEGRSTHIDASGQPVHGNWFLDLDVFHKGFARARDEAGWMHIDSRGRPLYSRRFGMVEPFYNGQARVERTDGALEVIDERGEAIRALRITPQLQLGATPRIGTFTLDTRTVLARTAWGTVRPALDALGERVVAKTTHGSHTRELEVLRLLAGHPHVPGVRGRVDVDGGSWLLLEYRPGRVLGTRNRCPPMPVGRALSVVLAVLEVCARLHAAGFAHTDLHPENVLVDDGGAILGVTVLDFAHAIRLGADGAWHGEVNWGRWEFVPPEQLHDFTTLDATADVYAAAALLAYLIRGTAPFRIEVKRALADGGWDAVRAAFLSARASPDLSGTDARLVPILRAALAMDPNHRPDARTLSHQLKEALYAHA